jgi:hypothetical protein
VTKVLREERAVPSATANQFRTNIEIIRQSLSAVSPALADVPWRDGGWSRKQIVGHLLDSAANNRQRFVRASIDGSYTGPFYMQEAWVKTHGYADQSWETLLRWWQVEHDIRRRKARRWRALLLALDCRLPLLFLVAFFAGAFLATAFLAGAFFAAFFAGAFLATAFFAAAFLAGAFFAAFLTANGLPRLVGLLTLFFTAAFLAAAFPPFATAFFCGGLLRGLFGHNLFRGLLCRSFLQPSLPGPSWRRLRRAAFFAGSLFAGAFLAAFFAAFLAAGLALRVLRRL